MNYTFAKKAGSVAVVTLFIVTILLAAYVLVAAPRNTHVQYFVVEPGQSTREIAEQLHKKNLIQSEFLFRLFSKGLQLDGKAKSGTYAVDRPETLLTWLFRVHRADYRVTPVKITLVEGLNIFETADVLAKNLPHISAEEFVRLATEYEGYLYPDTYLFLPDVSEVNVLNLLLRTFEEKTKDIFVERGLSEQEVADVINLASIVEE